MNSLDQSWDRLTTAARGAADEEVVPAVSAAWVTRVGALGAAELRQSRARSAWLAWTMPGFGVAMVVAIAAIVLWGPTAAQPDAQVDLVALADPLEGNSLLP